MYPCSYRPVFCFVTDQARESIGSCLDAANARASFETTIASKIDRLGDASNTPPIKSIVRGVSVNWAIRLIDRSEPNIDSLWYLKLM